MNKLMDLSMNTKIALGLIGGFVFALIIIPLMLGLIFTFNPTTTVAFEPVFEPRNMPVIAASGELIKDYPEIEDNFYITVFRVSLDEYQLIPFEEYILGVVAAEMPASWELGALQAQAIAARTYALRVYNSRGYILDTVTHQVYLDNDQLRYGYGVRSGWGDDFDRWFERIEEAVNSTRGKVLMYEGELIIPMFFSMSNGATENNEDVFVGGPRPYLRSVPSLGYSNVANFESSENWSIENLRTAFGDNSITTENIIILSTSEGGNVKEVQIGSNIYTGRYVRERLSLRSASFILDFDDNWVRFTTFGNGHGVGMSQHGANFMARNGYNYVEILTHFYQNIVIVEKSF